ncbi:MAG: Mut7-C RNAse domain-containing protein [candidate division Zixibacteria bacterium]|nr:Mut7-C RNAse domain-containing protein [candidate division Zixibacteria bacterium]
MKFLCDDNLGKLARYLRMLGYDTYFEQTIGDAELLSVMLKQGRIVLTRDSNLVERIESERRLLIESDSPEKQLKAVITQLNLQINKDKLFTRCLECNKVCSEVAGEDVTDEVFPYIIKTQDSFKRCPKCRRIYWQGSHYKDMIAKLKSVIEGLD